MWTQFAFGPIDKRIHARKLDAELDEDMAVEAVFRIVVLRAHVLSYLDMPSLLVLSSTNRMWRTIATDDRLWVKPTFCLLKHYMTELHPNVVLNQLATQKERRWDWFRCYPKLLLFCRFFRNRYIFLNEQNVECHVDLLSTNVKYSVHVMDRERWPEGTYGPELRRPKRHYVGSYIRVTSVEHWWQAREYIWKSVTGIPYITDYWLVDKYAEFQCMGCSVIMHPFAKLMDHAREAQCRSCRFRLVMLRLCLHCMSTPLSRLPSTILRCPPIDRDVCNQAIVERNERRKRTRSNAVDSNDEPIAKRTRSNSCTN